VGVASPLRIVALGDVHGQWAKVWAALRAAGAADATCDPTPAVCKGALQVVLSGDLVHYKDAESYALAAGAERFDAFDAKHLKRAARTQIRELHRFKAYAERSQGHVSVILGNHDEAVITGRYVLGTRGGLEHREFCPEVGGLALPDELAAWFASFPRELALADVHFAHAGPLPGMSHYDDFFYGDPDTKRWWCDKPELARQTGYRFGVYGHTVMPDGVHLDLEHGFAMVDALAAREFLVLEVVEGAVEPSVCRF
jgi:hypothetical protein